MDGYLPKPVNAQEMIGLVESLARKGSGIRDWGFEEAKQPATSAPTPLIPNPRSLIPSSLPSPLPVFNPHEALVRCFDSADMVREMIQCFFDEVDNLLPQMRAALAKSDLVEVARLGHRMKGTVLYLGAQAAQEAALRVERLDESGNGKPGEAEATVNALEHECIVLKAALKEHPLAADPKHDSL